MKMGFIKKMFKDDEEYGLFDVNAGFEEYFNKNSAEIREMNYHRLAIFALIYC